MVYSNDELELIKPYGTDRQQEIIDAIIKHESYRAAARALGISDFRCRKVVKSVAQRASSVGVDPKKSMSTPPLDGFVFDGYSTYGKNDKGEPTWFKAKRNKERQLEMAEAFIEGLRETLPTLDRVEPPTHVHEDLLTVLPMGDPHFGMYAWARECGDAFDLDIAKRDLCSAVDYLVRQTPPSKQCLIANLGDYFHYNNIDGVTDRGGHVLDRDTRLPKMFHVGAMAMRQCIQSALQRHEQVYVISAPGNHDEVLSHVLSSMFSMLFEDEPRVHIYDEPTLRHYHQFGKNLLGVVHGNKTKDAELMGIMATERPEEWGKTRHRYFYRGHLHHDRRIEYNGGIVEMFRTLAAKDSYAVGGGYLSGRDMKALVLHREYGEMQRYTCGIDFLRSIQ